MRKILSIMLSLAMIFSCFADVFAASSNDNTVRLAKTEGTVLVKDANGVNKSIPVNGKILTGYSVATGSDGCAYLTQGEKKLIKLDINTVVSVKQGKNKKKIEVFLETGNIFVNVSEKLGADEELNIRTTNTQTGVRGTMLEVSVVKPEGEAQLKNKLAPVPATFERASFIYDVLTEKGQEQGLNFSEGSVDFTKLVTTVNVFEGIVNTTTSNFVDQTGSGTVQASKTIQLGAGQSVGIRFEPGETQSSGFNTIDIGEVNLAEVSGSSLEELAEVPQERLEELVRIYGEDSVEEALDGAEQKSLEDRKNAEGTIPAAIEAEDTETGTGSIDNLYKNTQGDGGGGGSSDTPDPAAYTLTLHLDGGAFVTTPSAISSWTDSNGTLTGTVTSGTEFDLSTITPAVSGTAAGFDGWYTVTENADGTVSGWDEQKTSVAADNTDDIELYAKYHGTGTITMIAPSGYTIDPVDYSGVTDDGFSFSWGAQTVTGAIFSDRVTMTYSYGVPLDYPLDCLVFNNGSDTQYTATGWYSDQGCTDPVTGTLITDTGDKTVYAELAEAYFVTLTASVIPMGNDPSGWDITLSDSSWISEGSFDGDGAVIFTWTRFVAAGTEISLPQPTLTLNGDDFTVHGYIVQGPWYDAENDTYYDNGRAQINQGMLFEIVFSPPVS